MHLFLRMYLQSAVAFKNPNNQENFLFFIPLLLQRIEIALSGGGVLHSSNRAYCLVLKGNSHYTHTIRLLMEKTAMLSHFLRALDVSNRIWCTEIHKSKPGVPCCLKTHILSRNAGSQESKGKHYRIV